MSNDRYYENQENDNNRPNYTRKPKPNILRLIFVTAMVGAALYGLGKGTEAGVKLVKNEIDHLKNPYNYAEENKIVVIREGEGLLKAVEEIDGFSYEFDYRPIVEHIKEMPENEETLHGGEIVPNGAGIFVPVSMEKNDD